MASVVRCDHCGDIGDMDRDPGWVRVVPISRVYRVGQDATDAKDYCPTCAARMRAGLRPPIAQGLTHPVLGGGPTMAEAEAALRPLRDL